MFNDHENVITGASGCAWKIAPDSKEYEAFPLAVSALWEKNMNYTNTKQSMKSELPSESIYLKKTKFQRQALEMYAAPDAVIAL